MIIDAHQHFWQLGRFDYGWLDEPRHAPIRRDFLPSDLAPRIQEVGVDRTVFVQTQHNVEENRWVLQLTEENPWIVGVVGWVDLASPKCEEQLLEFKDHPKFVGVRHIVQAEPDDNFIVRDDVMRGLAVLEKHRVPYDLLFFVQHLRHAPMLAKRFPNLPLVIDHISKPKIKDGLIDDWRKDLKAAAAYPNVWCKLSGMVTEADWKTWNPADLKPYVETALECFGANRCMFGTDWPVCELAGTYRQVYDALVEVLGPISESERARIFGGSAIEFYGLKV
ncbi:MAG: amidohydrolase family protein [Gemmataceae bacterium]|nr:amidohydrolase family protein [Gemmataceae bacterium]